MDPVLVRCRGCFLAQVLLGVRTGVYLPRTYGTWAMFLPYRLLPRGVHSSCAVLGPQAEPEVHSSQFVVCGAGAGGLAVASRLARKFGEGKVAIVDPAQVSQA